MNHTIVLTRPNDDSYHPITTTDACQFVKAHVQQYMELDSRFNPGPMKHEAVPDKVVICKRSFCIKRGKLVKMKYRYDTATPTIRATIIPEEYALKIVEMKQEHDRIRKELEKQLDELVQEAVRHGREPRITDFPFAPSSPHTP